MPSRSRLASIAARLAAGLLVATVAAGAAGSQELEKFIGVTAQGDPPPRCFQYSWPWRRASMPKRVSTLS